MFVADPNMTEDKIVNDLKNLFGKEFTFADVKGYCRSHKVSESTVMKRIGKYRVGKGRYNLELKVKKEVVKQIEKAYEAPAAVQLVPEKDDRFVSFGNFPLLKKIIKSGIFYPSFITGLSGNGKTFGVEQACAQLGRELVRVNITVETDEDDLVGGFRLVNGDTVWHNGPVIEALERGAILLLDEIDLASNKILCLQSILEGKGVYLKKIGKVVKPAPGFNVIATANTKGKGSEDGRFIGTNVLNEAFLERFALTFEQEYPSAATETNILKKLCKDDKFCARLADWADIIRKTFYDGGIDEIISTRRLVHIIQAYKIFGDKVKAIQLCLNRFDDETKQSFLDLYDKVDNDVDITQEEVL
tara:strand:- start:3050 stop:4126 length:1077 start_codon:yes stop_codon:yes gene_type:complete